MLHGLAVGLHDEFFAGKGAHEHNERALRQVEGGEQTAHHLVFVAGVDEDVRIAAAWGQGTTMAGGEGFEHAHTGGAHGQHAAAAIAPSCSA